MTRALPVRVRGLLPIVAPAALLIAAYFFAIEPRLASAKRARAEAASLEIRLQNLQALTSAPVAGGGALAAGALREFERRTPADDRVADVLEQIARLAVDGSESEKARDLLIETGERVEPKPQAAEGTPRVAEPSAELPDPRFALFTDQLVYTPATVTFDASYARVGQFFWALRGLPTTIEIRSLEITRPSPEEPLVRARLVVFAYQRSKAGDRRAAAPRAD